MTSATCDVFVLQISSFHFFKEKAIVILKCYSLDVKNDVKNDIVY